MFFDKKGKDKKQRKEEKRFNFTRREKRYTRALNVKRRRNFDPVATALKRTADTPESVENHCRGDDFVNPKPNVLFICLKKQCEHGKKADYAAVECESALRYPLRNG
jgi:hypothetical protein